MTDASKANSQARSALLDEICSQLLAPECGLFVEDVLPRLPNYDSEELLDLIDAELCRRTDRGETPAFDEFAARFPKLSMDTLGQLFEVHLLESGARQRETPTFQLPGIVQGALIASCDEGEIRRARPEGSTRWIAVRVFATGAWSAELRRTAAKWIEATTRFQHTHLLNYQAPVHDDNCGNLYAWLPNAEGTPFAHRIARPMHPRQAANYLLPVAGAVELARQQGVWLGHVRVEDLQIDHYNRLRLLGSGQFSPSDLAPGRSGDGEELDGEELGGAAERETQALLWFGELWETMIGSDGRVDDEALEPEVALARERAEAMARACRESQYEHFEDFIFDLDLMRRLDHSTRRSSQWKCEMSSKFRWLPWR